MGGEGKLLREVVIFLVFFQVIIDGLAAIGHNYTISSTDGFAALTAIAKNGNNVSAVYDNRRGGNSTVFAE